MLKEIEKNQVEKCISLIPDKYSELVQSNKDEEFPNTTLKKLDEIIYKTVYRILNESIYDKIDSYIHLAKVNKSFLLNTVILNINDLKRILDEIETELPTVYEVIDRSTVELGIFHYVARFLYDFTEYIQEMSQVDIYLRKNRKRFMLNNIYKVFFKVFKHVRGFIYQQVNHLLSFNLKSLEKIYNLLYIYTDLDEDTLIMYCIDSFCCNIIYKYNLLKSRNVAAVIKSLYRKVLNFVLSTPITLEEDSDIIDTSYRVIFDVSELERLNTKTKFTFLISMLSTTYELSTNISVNDIPIGKKYLLELSKQNYIAYNKTTINIFRMLLFYIHNNFNTGKDIFKYIYDDFTELTRIVIDKDYKKFIKQKYKELYRFAKSIAIIREVKSRTRKMPFNFNRQTFKTYFKTKFTLKVGSFLQDEFIEEISEAISKYTYDYLKRTVFIHAITQEHVTPFSIEQFYSELAELYIDFIFN